MSMTESQVVANELEHVDDLLVTLFDRDATFYSTLEKAPVEVVSPRDLRIPLELRPGGNFGHFDADGGDLGLGDGPTFDKAVISTANFKMGVQWTKKAEWATDDSRKSVLNTLKHLLAKSMSEFRRRCDAACMTDGTGTIGTITSVATGGSKDTYTCTTDGFGVRLMRYGQYVHVYSSDLLTSRTTTTPIQIDLYDLQNKQVRLASNVSGSTAGDKIVLSGLTATPPVSLLGIPYHHNSASTGTWLGFTRSTTPEIRANRVYAGSSFAPSFARLALNKVGDRVGLDHQYKAEAWMHPCQKHAYEEFGQMISVINKSAKEEALDVYFDNMQLAGAPVKVSYNWDKTRIDFICKEVWKRAEMRKAGFYDVDGRKIFEIRGATGGVATSQIFYLVVSFNIYANNPAACAYIDGLTVPAGY